MGTDLSFRSSNYSPSLNDMLNLKENNNIASDYIASVF